MTASWPRPPGFCHLASMALQRTGCCVPPWQPREGACSIPHHIQAGSTSRPQSTAQSHPTGGRKAEAALPCSSEPTQDSSVPPNQAARSALAARSMVFFLGPSSPSAHSTAKPGKAPQTPAEARGGEFGWRGRLRGFFFLPKRNCLTDTHSPNSYQ